MDAKTVNPIDQDLDRLENDIRRLKVEFDIYFNGGMVRPPYDTKGRVETAIKRVYDMRGLSFGQRFRYNSLVARYNSFRDLWRKQVQEREVIGRLAAADQAHVAARSYSVVVRCRDPLSEPEKISELYDHLIAAKRECGERVGSLSLETFGSFLKSRSEEIKHDLKTDAVDFVVGVADGHVKFVARPAGRSED